MKRSYEPGPTVEQYIDRWLTQPGTQVTEAERQFIRDMRKAAAAGVGYGWMQSILEVEWEHVSPATSWGPTRLARRIDELEMHVARIGGNPYEPPPEEGD